MYIPFNLLVTSIVSVVITAILYWILCLLMTRRIGVAWDAKIPDVKQRSIQYHNEAIYKDFTFFIKVTLALMGGVAYILLAPAKMQIVLTQFLLSIAALLQFVVGLIFAVFVMFHQKSKIERWEKKPTIFEPFLWQEFWIVVSMMVISSNLTFVLIPELARIIV